VKFRGYCLFILFWSLLVYCPLCHMIWGGGLVSGDAIDLAGGTVIHIAAGTAGLVCALMLGKRRGYPRTAMHPNNLVLALLGAGLLWVGWFGFNSGSFVQSNLGTRRALAMTQLAAAAAALMWVLIESVHLKKATSLGMASGIIAGLVAITPAAGAVTTLGALAVGAAGAAGAYGAIMIKNKLGYDDSLDVFGVHGVGGTWGALATGLFIAPFALPDGAVRSPDAAWVAYQSDESGRFEVYLRPFPEGEEQVTISTGGGSQPRWTRGGREIVYLEEDRVMAVELRFEAGRPAPGRPQPLFERPFDQLFGWQRDFDVSPDGRSFALVERPEDRFLLPDHLLLVQSFHEELRRLGKLERSTRDPER